MSIMMKDGFWKPTRKNDFLLWLHRRVLRLASWTLNFVDTYPCENCVHADDYGCLQDMTLGAPCIFEPKVQSSASKAKTS